MSENHTFCCKCGNPSPEGGGCSSKNILKSQSSANVRKTENTGSSQRQHLSNFKRLKGKKGRPVLDQQSVKPALILAETLQ